MEYAMSTLIAGGENLGSLIGTTAHELAHSWFQFLLATNEMKYAWMDEGFTSYISNACVNEILNQNKELPNERAYTNYFYLVRSDKQEPISTISDHYESNFSYGISAYNKGSIFLSQLGYIIGKDNLDKTIKKYYDDFKFTHPVPNDIKRTAEKVSGLKLEWYLNYWVYTTKVIDYAVASIEGEKISLERRGSMPMPIDLLVTYEDGSTEEFNIPIRMMYGYKPTSATVLDSWSWTNPKYTVTTSKKIKSVQIDPKNLMADIDRDNNTMKL